MKLFWRALLVASLAMNVVLVLVRSDALPAPSVEAPPNRAVDSIIPSFPAGSGAAAVPHYEGIERAILEQRLVAAQARLTDLTELSEAFAGATRSLETEARVKPFLDDVFAQYKVAEPKYRFECRARVCKIDSDIDDEWTMPLQRTYPTRAIFREMSFSPAGTFIQLAPPADIPASFLSGMVIAAYVRARRPCDFAQAPTGDLAFALEYDAATRKITQSVTGSLAAQPIAACVTRALEDVISTTTLPPEMTTSVRGWPDPLSLPVDDDD